MSFIKKIKTLIVNISIEKDENNDPLSELSFLKSVLKYKRQHAKLPGLRREFMPAFLLTPQLKGPGPKDIFPNRYFRVNILKGNSISLENEKYEQFKKLNEFVKEKQKRIISTTREILYSES